ncbi:hypothetical protein PUN28_019304 [Cardiocondyla obscurior]|uniref:AAA+ ATPase domain-containing protein n=1 Tax=Cardiocondyla obscurior TaxID=286306 RepID=A0AAW2EAW9_9HYME
MADEYPDPDEEFDLIHQADYECLKELEDELVETRSLSQAGSGNNKTSWTKNESEHGANVELPILVNTDKVSNTASHNKKCNYEDLYSNSVPSTSKKRNYKESFGNNIPGNSKKQSYEELFGDISDFLDTDVLDDINVEKGPKEKKLRWDQPEDVIKKILDARQLLHEHDGGTSAKINSDNKKNSISLRVPPWNFVAVTRSYDSQRLYIKVRNTQNNIKQSAKSIVNLFSIPYMQLKAQAEKIITKKQTLPKQLSSNLCNTNMTNNELWVDKYRPRSYMELLSDETVNRQFLHWLKLWDKVVFHRNYKPKKTLPLFGKKKIDETDIEEVDSKGYPIKRIALLSGPPGLGKTTLAHIVARHAGYNVVEINASDERTPEAFRQILLASTEMKAVIGADPRPNCLIFDEIDGAPTASIELLLQFIQGKLVPKNKKGKKQSEKTSVGCMRPIVCICNEPYIPSLRTLRAAAVIISVPEVSPLRLAERLMDLAKNEKLNIDFGDLVKLAERSGCDVRACIGALQYMGSTDLKDNLSLGLKDTRKNLFDSWKSILTIPMNKKGVLTIPERIQNIFKTVQNGDMEKLAQGIFHNYPEVCDQRLDNVPVSLEWFQFYDLITSFVTHKQVWSLMSYTNHGFIAWHLHLARAQKIKLSYPSVFNEIIQKLAKNFGILTEVRKVCGRDVLTLTTDVAAFLPDILAPKLRTVPCHLYSPKEKADLTRIVNVMIEFGLSFVQEKNLQGGYIYNLDPNILEIGIFPDCNVHRNLAYAIQQIIAQELEVERLKRASILTGLSRVSSENMANPGKPEIIKNAQNKSNPSNITKQSAKELPLKEIVYKDFFGNIIKNRHENTENQDNVVNRISPKSQKMHSLMQNILTKYGCWYKYKEGCNNAVRRNVPMGKFL